MTDLALRPRSPTELVDAAFQVFRRDPMQFIVATAAVYVPWLIIRLVFDVGISGALPTPQQALTIALAGLVVYAVVGGVITVIASDVYLGAPADAMRALRLAATRIVPLLAASIVTLAFIVLGAILFLLPALYPMARFFAIRQAVMLEGSGAGDSLGRSSQLSMGVKGHVLKTLLLVLLVTSAVSFGSGLLAGLISSRVVVNVLLTAVSVVLYPFFGITETLLYYDVRIRKEGFDVEYLAAASPAAAGQDARALIAAAWQDAARDTISRWSTKDIHDTVAAIAKQPAYARSIRQSLFGRFLRFVLDRLSDLERMLGGSSSARLIVITAVALIVVVIVARIVVARRLEEQRSRVRAARFGARDRKDHWAAARELANAGDYAAACHVLYAAVLDSLARGGAVRVHPSKTSGDYARELTRRSAIAAPTFATFARQFERTVFSTEAVSAEDFDRLSAAAARVAQPGLAA